jgi:hypothetical protein
LPLAKELALKHNFHPTEIKLSNAKGKWGSCHSNGHIRLNWRLIKAPKLCQDYVICHELAHLKEMNHSVRFWALVAVMQPRFREAKAWLRAHQQELLAN